MILAASMLSASLVSCKKEEAGEESVGFDISEYSIVFSSSADDSLEKGANALKDRIALATGKNISVRDDREVSDKEILVGYTDREEMKSLKARLDEVSSQKAFAIEVSGNKICIIGKNADVTLRALKYFAVNYIADGKVEIPEDLSIAMAADTSTVITV